MKKECAYLRKTKLCKDSSHRVRSCYIQELYCNYQSCTEKQNKMCIHFEKEA